MFKARVSMLNPKFDVEIETPTYNETVKLLDAIVEKLKCPKIGIYHLTVMVHLEIYGRFLPKGQFIWIKFLVVLMTPWV